MQSQPHPLNLEEGILPHVYNVTVIQVTLDAETEATLASTILL